MKALFFPFIAILALAACQKDQIEVRRTPKEDLPAAMQAPGEGARPRGLRWKTPAGWNELAGNGMRVATFELPKGPGKAEVTVVALPGDVGGELANVNRWRGQLALPPIDETQLPGLRRTVRSPAGEILVYDFTGGGAKKTRMLAGMISASGTMWFFKLMGDDAAVEAAKPAFLKFLATLKTDAS
ncbi:MAG: hypothetical protein ACHQ51_08915 [Elusimicrobiota bacterium]